MVINCVAYGCNNLHDARKRISFHSFPFKRPKILKLWIKAIGREPGWYPSKTSKLCGQHFLPSDFKIKPRGTTKLLLEPEAVPSVFSTSKQSKTLINKAFCDSYDGALPQQNVVRQDYLTNGNIRGEGTQDDDNAKEDPMDSDNVKPEPTLQTTLTSTPWITPSISTSIPWITPSMSTSTPWITPSISTSTPWIIPSISTATPWITPSIPTATNVVTQEYIIITSTLIPHNGGTQYEDNAKEGPMDSDNVKPESALQTKSTSTPWTTPFISTPTNVVTQQTQTIDNVSTSLLHKKIYTLKEKANKSLILHKISLLQGKVKTLEQKLKRRNLKVSVMKDVVKEIK